MLLDGTSGRSRMSSQLAFICLQLSAFSILMPSLIVSYLGEGAYLVKHPEDYGETFWKSLPHGTFWPM